MNIGELKQLQSLPLEYKERKTVNIVNKFLIDYDAYVSVAGVDSYVLNDLLERNGMHLPKASISRAEPYGNNKLNAKLDNITFLRPDMEKKKIIRKHGYPIISKQISMAVSRYNNTKFEEQKEYRLWGRTDEDGNKLTAGVIPQKYHNLIYAPFELTEKCCDIIKKRPLKRFEKENNLHPITGELAEESDSRLQEYLKHGCIMNNKKRVKCTPLGFWTNQDIMNYIKKYDLSFSKEYGKIVEDKEQVNMFSDYTLKYEKAQRTGCDICTFGIMYDKERFIRLKKENYLIHTSMIRGGEWIECKPRLMIITPNTRPVMSNVKWVPNEQGYGYKFVIDWLNKMFNAGIKY